MRMGKRRGPPAVDLDDRGAEAVAVPAKFACTNNAWRRAAHRLGQLYDEALAPIGLKATQAGLLAQIGGVARRQEGPTLQDLAERLAIGISALPHALGPLVRDELVELRQDPQDGRTSRGILTRLGKARLREALPLWAAANRRVETILGPVSAEKLRGLADQVASQEFLDAYTARKKLGTNPEGTSPT